MNKSKLIKEIKEIIAEMKKEADGHRVAGDYDTGDYIDYYAEKLTDIIER